MRFSSGVPSSWSTRPWILRPALRLRPSNTVRSFAPHPRSAAKERPGVASPFGALQRSSKLFRRRGPARAARSCVFEHERVAVAGGRGRSARSGCRVPQIGHRVQDPVLRMSVRPGSTSASPAATAIPCRKTKMHVRRAPTSHRWWARDRRRASPCAARRLRIRRYEPRRAVEIRVHRGVIVVVRVK